VTLEAGLALVVGISSLMSTVLWLMYQKLSKILSITRAEIERGNNNVISQLEALLALQNTLKLTFGLPPTRGWAASPDFLRNVMEHALSQRPRQIVECSSGISTVVLARCVQMNGEGHVYSLEHDRTFADKTRTLLRQQGLESYATVIDAPLTQTDLENWGGRWYSTDALPKTLSIDLLVIDGPPIDTAKAARYPAIPVLGPKFHNGTAVFLDDANRADESWAVEKWLQAYPQLRRLQTPQCEKGCAALEMTARSVP
jgi:hypothetical protein